MPYFVLPPGFSIDDAHRALSGLEADFRRFRNPFYVWRALALCKRASMPIPPWVIEDLMSRSERLFEVLHQAACGKRSKREAHLVGTVLGFGSIGTGQGSRFKCAMQLERDREIHQAVQRQLQQGVKLDSVYSEVAKPLGVSRSTVVRAHLRMKRLSQADDET
jgi:hypothetical protein